MTKDREPVLVCLQVENSPFLGVVGSSSDLVAFHQTK